MKTLICILALFCLASTLEARSLPFEKHGCPFYSRKIEFIWAAPTNQLPATLRVLNPLSSKFPANVVSNLIALSGFTEEDRTTTTYQGEKLSKDVVAFRSKPRLGSIPARAAISIN